MNRYYKHPGFTLGDSLKKGRALTLMSINFCIGSYHCNNTTLDSSAPHRNTQSCCRFLAGDKTIINTMHVMFTAFTAKVYRV